MKRSKPLILFKSFLIFILLWSVSCVSDKTQEEVSAGPKVFDDRLELTLIAENPDIVTPIGIAIDGSDNIYVLESHTHTRPKNYQGPEGDIIKVFKDTNGDGKWDQIHNFAEGFNEGVLISFSPEGNLYVVTSKAVWALFDHNKDGICEEKVKVIELVEPNYVYAHAALLGITFDNKGWMYVSRGNTGGDAWKMIGTDGSTLSGYGDGGNIIKAKLDGSELEEVATGFWNPIDLKFDDYGRLLVADNDPDSRGPNRLLHIIQGGNYGYKSLYGGSGIHPYLAWNGELPGTLPYAAGLGEAPSGLLNASQSSLPKDYEGAFLCTIWEESRIVRIGFSKNGTSIKGKTEIIIEGDEEFRPVAFDTDNKGNIYFTDWVLRDYSNHGRGRIWKITAKSNELLHPKNKFETYIQNDDVDLLTGLYNAKNIDQFEKLKEALNSEDPFILNAAIEGLSNKTYQEKVLKLLYDEDAPIRLGALLALKKAEFDNPIPHLKKHLKDEDVSIRQMALIWTGTGKYVELKPYIDQVFNSGNVSGDLFETYLETIKHLQPEFIEGYAKKSGSSKLIERKLPYQFVQQFIKNKSYPAQLRGFAVKFIEDPQENKDLLFNLLNSDGDSFLMLETIRTLASVNDPEVAQVLKDVAVDNSNSHLIRAEAILALSFQSADHKDDILPLLNENQQDIQLEALRYLRSKVPSKNLVMLLEPYKDKAENSESPFSQQFRLATLKPENSGNKSKTLIKEDKDEYIGGDPSRGRRVFYSRQALCSSCHATNGRGGDLGPDLTNVGLSKSRGQILNSIINPSDEISPEWQGWFIKLKDGTTYHGRQIDVGSNDIVIYTQTSGFIQFEKDSIENYGMIEKSLMPEGLEKHLTESDLKDLLAFLESGAD